VSISGGMPTSRGSIVAGASGTGGPQDATKDCGLQDPSAEVAHGDGMPIQEAVPETDSTTAAVAIVSLVMGNTAIGGPTGSIGPMAGAPSSPPKVAAATTSVGADDNAIKEPKVILGHSILRAPGDVSLSEALGMAHWVLNQVHDVLRQEREDIDDKQRCLLLWVSLLKKWMTSEKEKVEVKRD
jgi:hypothetical protein